MNECDRIHPRLPDYLRDKLSMTERRWVARHLNLCASARRELDEYKSGARKAPPDPGKLPALPWDQKILAWIARRSGAAPAPPAPPPRPAAASRGRGQKTGLIGMLFMAVLVVPVTPLLLLLPHQVWGPVLQLPWVRSGAQGLNAMMVEARTGWLHQSPAQAGWTPAQAPQWSGSAGPVAEAQQDCVTVEQDFDAYWQLLQPGVPEPSVNFDRQAVVLLFGGQKDRAGWGIRLTGIDESGQETRLLYQERVPGMFSRFGAGTSRPWSIMVIPRPQKPVVFVRQ